MNTLTLSYYTPKEFRATHISSMGEASEHIEHIQKLTFYASHWWLTVQDGGLIGLTCEVEGLNCLQTKWEA